MAVLGRGLLETAPQEVSEDAQSSCGQYMLCSTEVSAWRQLEVHSSPAGTEGRTGAPHMAPVLRNAGVCIPGGHLHLNRRQHELHGWTNMQLLSMV